MDTSSMTEDQAREAVSRMFEEMGKTLNGIGDYPESEYETDSEDDSKKGAPARINTSSSTATGEAAGEGGEPKKKKKKKKKKKSNKPDLEDLLDNVEPADKEEAYDINKSVAERVEIAITTFRKNRKFSNERAQIFSVYLDYGGIKTGPKSFQGGAVMDEEDGDPDYEAMKAGIDRVDEPEEGEEVDFTNVVTTFLSEHFLKNTGWIDMVYYKDTPLVVAAMLNYFLVRNVLPEYEQDIRSALAIAKKAQIELPLCKIISTGLPSRYDKACSLLYGGEFYGFLDDSWQDKQVLIDALGMDFPMAKRIVQSLIGPDTDLNSLTVGPREYMCLEVISVNMPQPADDAADEVDSPTESPADEDPELVAMVDKMLLGESQSQDGPSLETLSKNQIEPATDEVIIPISMFADVTFAELDPDLPRDQQKPISQRRKVHVYFDPAIASRILLEMRVDAYVYTLSNGMSYLQQAAVYPTFYLEREEVEVPWDEWEEED
ncbi:hypothetical protein BGX21_004474 [Mortierella sp. AD011]|nr:hypothetical protein BGX21_004474 [Mortierella sp. AD011]